MTHGFSTLDPIDYLYILLRRKWIILICVIVGLGAAGVTFVSAPKIYASTTLIMVESQKVPTNVVSPVIVDTLAERLNTIKQQILSRSLLKKIIDEFGLYSEAMVRKDPVEEIVERMREEISISTVGQRDRIQAFYISYEGIVPETVQAVTSKLASLFIDENLKVREQLIEGTATFLHQELQRVEDQINQKEKAMSEYKRQFMGSLPDQLDANLRQLDRLQLERQLAEDALITIRGRRELFNDSLAFRERKMEMERREIGLARTRNTELANREALAFATERGEDPSSEQLHFQALQQALTALQADYTEAYPEVIRIKRQIAELETKLLGAAETETNGDEIAAELDELEDAKSVSVETVDGAASSRALEDPILSQEALAIELERERIKKRKIRTEAKILEYEQRVEEAPVHALKIGSMQRDYDNVLRNYQSLLDKKLAADVSENLEKRQKGERFRIVDPANLPEKPVKPNPAAFFVGGVAGGLFVAFAFIGWTELRILSFQRPTQIEQHLGLPILAAVPHMSGLLGQESRVPTAPPPRWLQWREKGRASAQAVLNAQGAEQLRVLGGRIIRLQAQKGIRVFAVTSAVSGEGKTTLATALAAVLARDYLEKTVLVDGDMINPGVSNLLRLENGLGLMSVLEGQCELDAALYQDAFHPNLMILGAGTAGGDHKKLAGRRFGLHRLFAELKQREYLVIVDAPPLLSMANMHLYSVAVDCTLMVIRARQTAQASVVEGLKFLVEAGGRVEGAIVNDLPGLPKQETPYLAKYSA